MTYRVRRREDIGSGLLRLLTDDLDAAEHHLVARGDRDRHVHRIRQRLKRMRTLLRTLKPAFGDKAIQARTMLGDAGRLLSRTRSADVAALSARALAQDPAAKAELGLDAVVTLLDREAEIAHRTKTPVGAVALKLAAARAEITGFAGEFDGRALADRAVARAYRKGRHAMAKAEETQAVHDLHAWRKSVKDLWHLLRVLRSHMPAKARKDARDLAALGELLGQDNDHAELAEKLALSPDAGHNLLDQLAVVATKRRALEAEAFQLGERLYGRKPKAAARRYALN